MAVALYLCPMKQRPGGALGRMPRYCAMDDFTLEITASMTGGEWREAEIENDQAIVLVRASDPMLVSLGLVFRRLTRAEADGAWTPTRLLPMWDAGRIVFSTRAVATKTLDRLAVEVPAIVSADFTALLGVWAAIGFGLGWRLPHWLCSWAVAHHLEPDRWVALLAPFLDSRGAFGDTALRDAFTRANEDPLGNGTWGTNWFGTPASAVKLVSNAAVAQAAFSSSFWSAATFGPDSEEYHLVSTPGTGQQGGGIRMQQTGTAGVDGYEYIHSQSTNLGSIYQMDNGAETLLGATISMTVAAGDSTGMDGIGATPALRLFKKSGGTWAQQGTNRTATAAYSTGHIGFDVGDLTEVLDDFSGGTVVVAGGSRNASGLSLLGVGV